MQTSKFTPSPEDSNAFIHPTKILFTPPPNPYVESKFEKVSCMYTISRITWSTLYFLCLSEDPRFQQTAMGLTTKVSWCHQQLMTTMRLLLQDH